MYFQQVSPFIVVVSYCLRNYPYAIQIVYFIAAVIYAKNRSSVVTVRLCRRWWPFSLEPTTHKEYMPKNFVFYLISCTCLLALAVINC